MQQKKIHYIISKSPSFLTCYYLLQTSRYLILHSQNLLKKIAYTYKERKWSFFIKLSKELHPFNLSSHK